MKTKKVTEGRWTDLSIEQINKALAEVYDTICAKNCRMATKFLGPKQVVRMTRRHKFDKRQGGEDFVVSVSRPNCREAEFIKRCRKAGEPFPVRKVQMKFWKEVSK